MIVFHDAIAVYLYFMILYTHDGYNKSQHIRQHMNLCTGFILCLDDSTSMDHGIS